MPLYSVPLCFCSKAKKRTSCGFRIASCFNCSFCPPPLVYLVPIAQLSTASIRLFHIDKSKAQLRSAGIVTSSGARPLLLPSFLERDPSFASFCPVACQACDNAVGTLAEGPPQADGSSGIRDAIFFNEVIASEVAPTGNRVANALKVF